MSVQKAIRLHIRNSEQVAVTTAGTPVNPTLIDEYTEAVHIINNSDNIVCVGESTGGVDAVSTPKKGIVLYPSDSAVLYTSQQPNNRSNSDIFIDADTDGTIVTVQILGS